PNPLNLASDWKTYVEAFKAKAGEVRIAAFFNGVAATKTEPAKPAEVSYDKVVVEGDDFWLVPVPIKGIQTSNYAIKMSSTELEQNIYTQGGTLHVYDKLNGKLVKDYVD